jgi:hypothetical protein
MKSADDGLVKGPATISITEARKTMAALFSEVVNAHRPSVIEHQSGGAGLLLAVDDADRLLVGCEFHPEVFFESEAASIWLPELELYGRGAHYEAAEADLLDEVRAYAEEYWKEIDRYRAAPNRQQHFPYLLRAILADRRGELRDVLFAEPQGARREEVLASA